MDSPADLVKALAFDDVILNVMCRSPLADVPWPLITTGQVAKILRGENVEPTPYQKREAMRLAGQFSESRKPLNPLLALAR